MKETVTRDHILYGAIYIKYLEQIHRYQNQIIHCLGVGLGDVKGKGNDC